MANLSLERLVFDTADMADSANVGAYLRAADGTLITHTGAALDINIASSDIDIQVDLDLNQIVADDAPDTENPLKVGSRTYNQGAVLAPVSAAGDKANLASDLYRRVFMNDAPNVAALATAVTVGATAVALPAAALAGRMRILIQNVSNNDIWVGDAAVTMASGIKVSKGSTMALEVGQAVVMYAIAAGAGNDIRVLELA